MISTGNTPVSKHLYNRSLKLKVILQQTSCHGDKQSFFSQGYLTAMLTTFLLLLSIPSQEAAESTAI